MTTSAREAPSVVGGRLGAGAVILTACLGLAAVAATALIEPVYVFALGVGALAAVVVVFHPQVGLLAAAAFTVLRLPDIAADHYGAPSLFQPLMALLGVAIALRWLTSGERPAGGGRAAAAVAAFGLVAVGSLVMAESSADGIPDLELFARDAIVAVMVGLLLRSTTALRRVVWILVGGGGVLATMSVLQVAGVPGEAFGGFAQSQFKNILGGLDDIRIAGPVGDANFYAQWLVMLVPFALDRMWNEPSRRLRLAAGFAAAAMGAAVVFTFSRGGAVALVVVAGAMLIRHPPRARTVVAVALAAVAVLPLLPSEYTGRLATLTQIGTVDSSTDISIRIRTSEFEAGVAMFSDSPLLGKGYGTYFENYPDYSREVGIDLRSKGREAHNLYLELAAETGVLGLAIFAGLILFAYASIGEGRRRMRRLGSFTGDDIGYAIGVSLAGYLITSTFLHMALARLPWLVIGLAFALPSAALTMARTRAAGLRVEA
jgi:hypothetical protein